MKGTLYVCSTPIGNLEDITLRAIRILKEVDLIAAEDTRVFQKILNHYDINTKQTSYHEHNENKMTKKLIEMLLEGNNIAVVSDAGTPGISDPGYRLISCAAAEEIEVTFIPGPTACIAGLVLSGLPSERFSFEGFVPRQGKKRAEFFESLEYEKRTMIFYEAPHRLKQCLQDMCDVFGERRKAALAKELTKKYEQVFRGELGEIFEAVKEIEVKGEYIIVLEGSQESFIGAPDRWKFLNVEDHIEQLINDGYKKNEAIKTAAKLRGLPRKEVYDYIVKLD